MPSGPRAIASWSAISARSRGAGSASRAARVTAAQASRACGCRVSDSRRASARRAARSDASGASGAAATGAGAGRTVRTPSGRRSTTGRCAIRARVRSPTYDVPLRRSNRSARSSASTRACPASSPAVHARPAGPGTRCPARPSPVSRSISKVTTARKSSRLRGCPVSVKYAGRSASSSRARASLPVSAQNSTWSAYAPRIDSIGRTRRKPRRWFARASSRRPRRSSGASEEASTVCGSCAQANSPSSTGRQSSSASASWPRSACQVPCPCSSQAWQSAISSRSAASHAAYARSARTRSPTCAATLNSAPRTARSECPASR